MAVDPLKSGLEEVGREGLLLARCEGDRPSRRPLLERRVDQRPERPQLRDRQVHIGALVDLDAGRVESQPGRLVLVVDDYRAEAVPGIAHADQLSPGTGATVLCCPSTSSRSQAPTMSISSVTILEPSPTADAVEASRLSIARLCR